MQRKGFYLKLVLLESWRMRRSFAQQTLIVAGICLPILILLGLKGGHVAELRKALVSSASGCRIVVYPKGGEVLTEEVYQRLVHNLPSVHFAVPQLNLNIKLEHELDGGGLASSPLVGVQSTNPGDPELEQLGIAIPEGDTPGIVLTREIADAIQAERGDTVRLVCRRGSAARSETAAVDLQVWGVFDGSLDDERSCYAKVALLDQIETFIRGNRVPERGWPATRQAARDDYEALLIFCLAGRDLGPQDRRYITEIKSLSLEEVDDPALRSLYGLIKPEFVESLRVYRAYFGDSLTDPTQRLNITAKELDNRLVDSDAAILPWNEPREFTVDGVRCRFVGVSPASRSWLENRLIDPALAFPNGSLQQTILLPESTLEASPREKAEIPFMPGAQVVVECKSYVDDPAPSYSPLQDLPNVIPTAKLPLGKASSGQPVTCVVPSSLLAHLTAAVANRVDFDPEINTFIPLPSPIPYSSLRAYARTIDEMPDTASRLKELGYNNLLWEESRIREIKEQETSLQWLVLIVAFAVFGFGILTVMSVLRDATDRMRRTIGILRVMGVSKRGIFGIVLGRAMLVGFVAALLAYVAAMLTAPILLHWDVRMRLTPSEGGQVMLATIVCCLLGALIPSWSASRSDPFENVVQGKFI